MKIKSNLMETLRFVITGGFCFAVEFVCLVLLRDTCGLDTLIATPIAFLITSVMGLLLNELFMLLFRYLLGEDTALLTVFGFTVTMYMLNKALSTLLVMVWNYFTKRAILRGNFPFFRKNNN